MRGLGPKSGIRENEYVNTEYGINPIPIKHTFINRMLGGHSPHGPDFTRGECSYFTKGLLYRINGKTITIIKE